MSSAAKGLGKRERLKTGRRGVLDRASRCWIRRSERTSTAVERAGREREPQSGRELVERLHGWPFCGDGGVVSEQGKPKAGPSAACPSRGRLNQRGIYVSTRRRRDVSIATRRGGRSADARGR